MAAAEDEVGQEQPKASKRDQWRGKLKDKANKLTKAKPLSLQREQDVAEFLRPGSSSTSASTEHLQQQLQQQPQQFPQQQSQQPPQQQFQQPPQQQLQHPQYTQQQQYAQQQHYAQQQPPRPNPVPPRIDTGATEQWSSVAPEDRLEPLGFPAPRAIKKRRPKPPGTHVSFSNQPPEVIGEGGDESEFPASQVIGSWNPSRDGDHLNTRDGSHNEAREDPPPLLRIGSDHASGSAALARAPTRARASTGWEQRRLSMSMEEGLVQAKREDVLDLSTLTLPEPTIPRLDFDFDSVVQPIEDKPYVTAQPEAARKKSVTPTQGPDGPGTGFLAYNPSIRVKAEPAKKSPQSAPDHVEPPQHTANGEDMPDFGASSTSVYSPDHNLPATLHGETDHDAKLSVFATSQISPPTQQVPNTAPQAEAEAFDAAEEFFVRMQHMRGSFKLTSERPHSALTSEPSQWLRASIWWFLKGRLDLEEGLRALHAQNGPNARGTEGLPLNKQCYINLTKSWWIMNDVLPDVMQSANHKGAPADGLDPQQIVEVYNQARWEISRFFLSLQRKNLFPPPALLVQGADPEIWVSCPSLPAGLYAMAATLNPRTLTRHAQMPTHLAFGMPLGDSEAAFSYGRFFGLAKFLGDPELESQEAFSCIVSVVRQQTETLAEFLIASQDGQLNMHVQMDKRNGPTYSDMRWTSQPNTMIVKLASDVKLGIQLREPDFRFLHNVNEYNRRLEVERYAQPDEELLYGDQVRAFHFMGNPAAASRSGFPSIPVLGCRVRLFQKNATLHGSGGGDGAVGTGGIRNAFNGYRLTVMSPTESKTLSTLTRQLPGTRPILFNNLRGEGGEPALALVLQEENGTLASLIFTFESTAKRAAFHTILAGTATSPDECFSDDIPLQSLAVCEAVQARRIRPFPQGIQWQRLRVINVGQNLDDAPCVGSERLRVCISCNYGSLTDRVNLGTGELRICLAAIDTTALTLWRPAQNNLTLAFTEGTVRSKDRALLDEALALVNSAPSLRTYRFTSLPVLHDFQALVTGFEVAYDGKASSFTIMRRRALVHKHVETEHTRIQVLRETASNQHPPGGRVMLVAFFDNFPAGKCLGMQLQAKDTYEGSARGGKFYVRFADARFNMRPPEEEGADLVCLDSPPPPNEHEDLLFGFDNEDERDLFARALPASIAKASRMANFRR